MATKEDILEQVVEEYLIHQGYFVRHNLKFRPSDDDPERVSNQDSNHSDIDVLGFHPIRKGVDRVWVVSCKSWQSGLKTKSLLDAIRQDKTVSGRKAWKGFRELVSPKWSRAFVKAVKAATGESRFTYVLAVTHVVGDQTLWENDVGFLKGLEGNPIKVITFREMVTTIGGNLGTTVAGTEIGRLLQMFKAAKIPIYS